MKTYSAKPSEVEKKWLLIDAEGVILGRLASVIAMRLRGKHKPMFTAHIDCGDNVVVINADKVRITGRKLKNDMFHWHTGFPGGLKSRSKGQILDGDHPTRVLENAVRRMMPKDSPLARGQMTCLRLFAGPKHDHEAQQPQVLDVGAMNPKNKRS